VLCAEDFHSPRTSNAAVFAPLATVLERATTPLRGVVVGTGPGSYTGVRVGIAVALGLSLAKECPVIGLPSITTLAVDALVTGDARRSSFFTAEIRAHQLVDPPRLHDEASFRAAVASSRLPTVTMDETPPLNLAEITPHRPSAAVLAGLAANLSAETWQSLASRPVEPLYVQAPYITQPKKNPSLLDG
jgi:tRNA threonylcarbamoyladenosine biosynthesis protein TsaB